MMDTSIDVIEWSYPDINDINISDISEATRNQISQDEADTQKARAELLSETRKANDLRSALEKKISILNKIIDKQTSLDTVLNDTLIETINTIIVESVTKIIRKEIKLDSSILKNMIFEIVKENISSKPTDAYISDMNAELLPDLQSQLNININIDPSLSDSDFIIKCKKITINATLRDRINNFLEPVKG